MVDVQAYNSLDEALLSSANAVKALYYISPINEKEQKKEFLASKTKNPIFQYKDLEYDPAEIETRLESIVIPDDDLGKIFQKKKSDTLSENKIIAKRGDEEIVRQTTIQLYGTPAETLVSYADKLLRNTPKIDSEKTISSDTVKMALEDMLVYNGLRDWRVEFSEKKLTTTYPAEKKITICKDREFAALDPKRLGVHEIGVHAIRAANGYEQPLKIFAIGLPGYLQTEEGLTLYFQERQNCMPNESWIKIAANVIAVDSVVKGIDFRQTFDRLKSYGLDNDFAWERTLRAHRGGGYIKDHIYLEGLQKVKDFASIHGDFKTLYVGKIGIEDLPLVRQLLQEGTLKEARYLPRFIES